MHHGAGRVLYLGDNGPVLDGFFYLTLMGTVTSYKLLSKTVCSTIRQMLLAVLLTRAKLSWRPTTSLSVNMNDISRWSTHKIAS